MTMKDSPNLDALRAIAVGLVVVSHLPDFVDSLAWSFNYKTLGRLGVAMFFVHTTLVLMMSLERQGSAAAPFLIRRFFRIYPLSIAAVLLMAALLWLGKRPVDMAGLASNLLLIQNITGHRAMPAPLWTLPYEVQMYLVLPALYAVTKSARPVLWVLVLCAGAAALAAASGASLIQYVPCFLPGALAYVLGRREGRLSPWVLFAVVGVGAVAIPALVAAGLPETPLFWALCLVLGVTIPACRQLTSKPLARCAKVVAQYSYGIYITHVLALGLAFALTPGPWPLQWAMFLLMLAGLSYAAYHGIEKHGIRLGVRLADRLGRSKQSIVTPNPAPW